MRAPVLALLASTALAGGLQVASSVIVERAARASVGPLVAALGGSLEKLTVRHGAFEGRLHVSAAVSRGDSRFELEGLTLPAPAGPLAILQPAAAQSGFTIASLTRSSGEQGSLTVRNVAVEGATMPQAALEALFDANAATPLSERMRRIGAARISAGEIEYSENRPLLAQRTVYSDVVLREVREGKAAEVTARGGRQSVEPKTPAGSSQARPAPAAGKFDATFGAMSMTAVDMGLMVRFLTEAAREGERPAPVAASSIVRDYVITLPEGNVTIASMTSGETRLRPLKVPLATWMNDMEALSRGKDKDSPENLKKTFALIGDFMAAIGVSDLRAEGIRMNLRDERQRPVTAGIGRMGMSVDAAAATGGFDLRDFDVTVPDGTVRMAEFSVEGASFRNAVEAVAKAGGDPLKLAEANPREFVPEIRKVRLAGIDIDVLEAGSRNNQRVKAKLGQLNLAMSNHQAAIPADVLLELGNLTFDIPPSPREEGLKNLKALGYDRFELSFRFDQAWDAKAETLAIRELSVDAPRMVKSRWSMQMGNVSKDVFDKDTAVQAVAALSVAARGLSGRIENLGLIDKLFEQQARQQRRKPEDVRRELGAGAAMAIPLFLGDHPAAKTLADAVSRFAAQPRSLAVEVTAKGAGLSAADFVGMADPQSLLAKVDIKAVANQ
jgi:hypothetical protein